MTAHASQIADDDVPTAGFAAAYGYEWFRRTAAPAGTAPGVLDALGNAHLLAAADAGRSAADPGVPPRALCRARDGPVRSRAQLLRRGRSGRQ